MRKSSRALHVSTATDSETPVEHPQCFTPGSRALQVPGVSSLRSIRRMADVLEQSTPKFRSPFMSSETAAYLADAFEPEAEAEIVEEIEACDEELGEPSVVEEEISADERSPVGEVESPVQFPAPQALPGGQRAGRRLRSCFHAFPRRSFGCSLRPSSCRVRILPRALVLLSTTLSCAVTATVDDASAKRYQELRTRASCRKSSSLDYRSCMGTTLVNQ